MRNLLLLLIVSTLASCGGFYKTYRFTRSINQNPNNNFVLLRTKGRNGHSDYSVFKDYGSGESSGKIYAINVSAYKNSRMSAQDFFNKYLGSDFVVEITEVSEHTEYRTVNYNYTYYTYETRVEDGVEEEIKIPHTGYGTVETPTSITDYHGENGEIFEEGKSQNKDLEKIASNKEGKNSSDLAIEIESKFGLSAERAEKVASLQLAYSKLKSKRALTPKEQSMFTRHLLGVDFKTAEMALKSHLQGDSADMKNILEKASELNQTSPEHMVEILGELLL